MNSLDSQDNDDKDDDDAAEWANTFAWFRTIPASFECAPYANYYCQAAQHPGGQDFI